VLVHVTDREKFRSFQTYYELIRSVARLHPGEFRWQEPPYEFEFRRPPIDMICGSDLVRKAVGRDAPFAEIQKTIGAEIAAYAASVRPHILYS